MSVKAHIDKVTSNEKNDFHFLVAQIDNEQTLRSNITMEIMCHVCCYMGACVCAF